MWYMTYYGRFVPLSIAEFLGHETYNYRWFAPMYLITMFFVIPFSAFGLSLLGGAVVLGVFIPLIGKRKILINNTFLVRNQNITRAYIFSSLSES